MAMGGSGGLGLLAHHYLQPASSEAVAVAVAAQPPKDPRQQQQEQQEQRSQCLRCTLAIRTKSATSPLRIQSTMSGQRCDPQFFSFPPFFSLFSLFPFSPSFLSLFVLLPLPPTQGAD